MLRRFKKHVLDRDWFAVGTDVLVVVVGIFIGLQVNNWNEVRKSESETQYYLGLLIHELEEDVRLNEAEIEAFESSANDLREAASLLYAKEWSDNDFENFKKWHVELYHLPMVSRRPVPLRILMEGGAVNLPSSNELRQHLFRLDNAYGEAIEFSAKADSLHEVSTLRLIEALPYGNASDFMAIPVSADYLINNQKLKVALRGQSNMHFIQLGSIKALQAARRTALAGLKKPVLGAQ